MSQRQCCHCAALGARVPDNELREPYAQPHYDSPACCGHVSTGSRAAAIADGGRYYDGSAWVCPWCGTAPAPTDAEIERAELAEYTYIVTSDVWGQPDVTAEEHVAACRRMEAWLTEHEGDVLSISVRPAQRGEGETALRDDTGRLWCSDTDAEGDAMHELLGRAWQHACETWREEKA